MIGEYYSKQEPASLAPERTEQREYGVGGFETKIRFRHLEFKNPATSRNTWPRRRPRSYSCSMAYYKNPSFRPMENEGFMGPSWSSILMRTT